MGLALGELNPKRCLPHFPITWGLLCGTGVMLHHRRSAYALIVATDDPQYSVSVAGILRVGLQWNYWYYGTRKLRCFTLLLLKYCMITAAAYGNAPPAYFSVLMCRYQKIFLFLVSGIYVAEVLPEDYRRTTFSYPTSLRTHLTTFQEFS